LHHWSKSEFPLFRVRPRSKSARISAFQLANTLNCDNMKVPQRDLRDATQPPRHFKIRRNNARMRNVSSRLTDSCYSLMSVCVCPRTEEKGLSSTVCYYSLELTTFTYNAAGAQINQFIISIVHSAAEQSAAAKRVSPPKTHAVRSPELLSNFSKVKIYQKIADPRR
jgi:hypothetical protein